MAPFRLEVSDHAALRLKQRSITREEVRSCIASGSIVGYDIRGRTISQIRLNGDVLIVIHLPIPLGAIVVTAYWGGSV